jgi:hypothetical protein
MTYEEAINEIESHELSARLNVASDMKLFLRGAQKQEAFRVIMDKLNSHDNAQRLFRRAIQLSQQTPDLRYENQWDTALTIYLWLFKIKDLNIAKTLAGVIARTPQCWWAKMLSCDILLSKETYVETGTKSINISQKEKQIIYNYNSNETILPLYLLHNLIKGKDGPSFFTVDSQHIKSIKGSIIDLRQKKPFTEISLSATEMINLKAA